MSQPSSKSGLFIPYSFQVFMGPIGSIHTAAGRASQRQMDKTRSRVEEDRALFAGSQICSQIARPQRRLTLKLLYFSIDGRGACQY
jgi:hypothetical protein